MNTSIKHLSDTWQRPPIRWSTIALFAVLIAYTNGFWMTSLQGAIGAIERNEPPFWRWLRDATIMLPLVFLAILIACVAARRWFGSSQHKLVAFWGTALVITLLSTGISLSEAAMSSLNDYRYQVHHLELMHSYGTGQPTARNLDGFGSTPYYLYCNIRGTLIGSSATAQVAGSAATQLEYATFTVHVRALLLDAALIFVTNSIITVLLLTALGEPQWAAAREHASQVATPILGNA